MGLRALMASFVLLSFVFLQQNIAYADLVPKPRTYSPTDMFGNGYKESLQKDGTWKVSAITRGHDGRGFSQEMALLRAAELVLASGKTHIQVLDFTGQVGTGTMVYGKEIVRIVVRASDEAGPPTDCKPRNKDFCVTLNAADIVSKIRPTVHP